MPIGFGLLGEGVVSFERAASVFVEGGLSAGLEE
jgi:hypothetical protein